MVSTPGDAEAALTVAIDLSAKTEQWRLRQTREILNAVLSQAGVSTWHSSLSLGKLDTRELKQFGFAGLLRGGTVKGKTLSYEWLSPQGKKQKFKIPNRYSSLHDHAAELARLVLAELGFVLTQEKIAGWIPPQPDFLHQVLGEGRAYIRSGAYRKAEFKFESALKKRKFGVMPAALDGMLLARARAGRHDHELARSGYQRARVAERQGKHKEAYESWRSFLQYSPLRARPFEIDILLAPNGFKYFRDDNRLWLNGSRAFVSIDSERGLIKTERKRIPDLLSVYSGDYISRIGAKIARRSAKDGHLLWATTVPQRLRSQELRTFVSAGIMALVGADELAWFDLTVGKQLQKAKDLKVLAGAAEGLLFSRSAKNGIELGFLKPGRGKPSWTMNYPVAPAHVALVRGRAVLRFGAQLHILDTRNGKQRGSIVKLGPSSAEFLGAQGRYAVYRTGESSTIVDVLAGIKTAEVKGPSRPLVAGTTPYGVVIAYASKDVLFFNREGKMLDRTTVLGTPLAMVRGHPKTPSQLLITTLGVLALGDIPDGDEPRDLDAYLAMSRMLVALDEPQLALQLLDHVASKNLGMVPVFEVERCRLLKEATLIQGAHLRAYSASDQSLTLPVFNRVGK